MKKTFIALAVAAGTITAAQADTTTLYGSIGFSSIVSQTSNDRKVRTVFSDKTIETLFKNVKSNHWDIGTSSLNLGVKGTEDLDNGLQAFFDIKIGQGGASLLKHAYMGLTGDFGTLTIGKQKSLFKVVTDTGLFHDVGIGYNSDNNYPGVVSKAVSYVSPASAGIQLGASVVADNKNFASLGADAWEVAAMYNVDGWKTGLVYSRVNTPDSKYPDGIVKDGTSKVAKNGEQEFVGLNVGYTNDQFGVVGRVTHESSVATEYGLEGEYYSGANTFRAGFGVHDSKAQGVKNVYNTALGYQYNFSKRTYTWVEGQYTDYNQQGRNNGFKALVGIRHDF